MVIVVILYACIIWHEKQTYSKMLGGIKSCKASVQWMKRTSVKLKVILVNGLLRQSLWPSVFPCQLVWSQARVTFGFFTQDSWPTRRNSYLSPRLIMPFHHPHSSWCGKVSFPHIARCSKKDYDLVGVCVCVYVCVKMEYPVLQWKTEIKKHAT